MKRLLFPLACLMALALFAGAAQARTSLVQDGKKTVFQRVITHPGAQLFAGPEQGAPVLRESVKTFTAMYIYDRKDDRLEVGVNSSRADGWINARDVTVWPQAITMLFTDRTDRAPVMFFRDHAAIDATYRVPSLKPAVTRYAGRLADKAPLLPVLNVDRQYAPLDLLEVASINPGISPAAQTHPAQLRTGFTFVIDTTSSMKMMVSDASPLGAGSPLSRTGLPLEPLADYLRIHKIYLTVLHAKSPNWHKDHACMELGDDRANCIPFDAATPAKGAEAFDRTARVLVKNYVTMLTATAQMSPGAQQFSLRPDHDLVRNDLLDEVLEGLPYTSAINSMTQRDWESMPSGERDAFIRSIKGLLVRYDAYDKDAANWESFGSLTPNDWVCRVPLSMLP